jgi:hypothetical protein
METSFEELAQLVAQSGPLSGQRWTLGKSNVIGRDETCDIVVADRQVSRQHARLSITQRGIILEDLNSKNGTNLNGESLKKPTLLEDGDEIQIAIAQKFIYLSSDATLPLDTQDKFWVSAVSDDIPDGQEIYPRRMRLDKRSHRVWITKECQENDSPEEVEIIPPLSASQFRLLVKLYENQGLVISRPELVEKVWGEEQIFSVSEQALDALVRRLRRRIAEFDPDHNYIVTVRGHGLRLENPSLNPDVP